MNSTPFFFSKVQVTGSSVMGIANFTGLNGISVFQSGAFVCITGGAGTVTQGQLNTLSGWADGIFVHRTGNEQISGNKFFNNNLSVSGDVDVYSGSTYKQGGNTILAVSPDYSNTFVGYRVANISNDNGTFNTYVGNLAGNALTSGNQNTFVGRAFSELISGNANVGIGYRAGAFLTTGSLNIFLGTNAGPIFGKTNDRNIVIGTNSAAQFDSDSLNLGGLIFGRGLLPSSTGGNVGIGTSNPTENLHITGNIRVEGVAGVGITPNAARGIFVRAPTPLNFAGDFLEKAGEHSIAIIPNSAGYNEITSNYIFSGLFLPLSLTSRNITSDLTLVSGNVGIGTLNPRYALEVTGNAAFNAGQYEPAKNVSSNYSVQSTDRRLYCNNAAGITLTFGGADVYSGQFLGVKLMNTGVVTLTGVFGQKFDGSDSYVMNGQYSAHELHANGQNWCIW